MKDINVKIIVRCILGTCLFMYSFKFLLFLVIPSFFEYLHFLKTKDHLSISDQNKMVLDYPQLTMNMNLYNLVVLAISVALIIVVLLRVRRSLIEISIACIILILISMSGVLSFANPRFYALMPMSVWNRTNISGFLLTNWFLFLCSSIIMYIMLLKPIAKMEEKR